jgi:hypothetical protein
LEESAPSVDIRSDWKSIILKGGIGNPLRNRAGLELPDMREKLKRGNYKFCVDGVMLRKDKI